MSKPPATPAPPIAVSSLDTEAVVRLAMRGARIGTWARNISDNVVEWSPELEEIFGLAPGTFGRTEEAFHQLMHPDDRPALAEAVERAIADRTDYVMEFRFLHASGEWRWMDGRGRATYDASGQPAQLYGVGMDITERKLAELTHARLAAIVESSADAIISKTLTGRITSWNDAAARLFGYTAEDMIGAQITRIIPDERLHEEDTILSKLQLGQRIEHFETVRKRKDGNLIDVSISISPIRDGRGIIIGASKIARDISGRKRTEEALREREALLRTIAAEREQLLASERVARSEAERLSRVKDEFLATLSHELRTPLNAIQGWATLLRHRELSSEDRVRGLETIERNVRAQAQIVNDLLDMSRIVSGKIHLEVQPIDLRDVVEAAIDVVRPSADAKRIRIRSLLDSSLGTIRGDPNRLQQVLWNLLTNAVKFTPPEGRIQVLLERVDSHVEITVSDNGMGIRPEFLPHVFDRFRQADPSTTRRHGGLGIGLSIVKNLVELHGGSVRVASAGENQGTMFVVSLPVVAVQVDETGAFQQFAGITEGPALDSLELPRLDGISVLIVDDEPDARQLVARILEEQGAKPLCAASAMQALEVLARESVDIVLSDIGMPDMNGYDLMRQIRTLKDPRIRRMPAIALTAYARSEDRQRSLLAGYQLHISKPVETRELIAGLASLLNISR